MTLWQAIVLAVVQGLTEFLPISSTAHLALVPWLFGWKDPGLTFDVALHLGTLVSVLAYFGKTWLRLVQAALGADVRIPGGRDPNATATPEEARRERLLFWFLVAATLPAGVAGLLLEKHIETTFRQSWLMAATLIGVALVMWWAERLGSFQKPLGGVSLRDAMVVGAAQATAVIPGVSRSGATIAAGLFRGMSRDAAARFSFLLSTPIIAGAAALKAWHLRQHPLPPEMIQPFLAGIVVSALVGYLAISGLVRYLRTRSLKIFIVYRIVFGIIILALAYFGHFE